jgi:hypothetical protein
LFFPIFSELKANFVCFSYEENAEDIYVLGTDVFSSLAYDEEVVSNTNHEQPCFDKKHVYEQQTVLIVHAEMISSHPTGGSEDEEKPLNQQMISSVLYPLVHVDNIKQHVRNDEIKEVTFYLFSMPCQQFHDPVNGYMELHFSNALDPANFIILSAVGGYIGDPKNVFS